MWSPSVGMVKTALRFQTATSRNSTPSSAVSRASLGVRILDLDSYNGTKVNGQRVVREILKSGDTIEFGLLTARYEKNGVSSSSTIESEPAQSPESSSKGARHRSRKNGTNGTMSDKSKPEVEEVQQSQLKLAIERARTHVDTARHELPTLDANGSDNRKTRNGELSDRELERARIELARLREKMATERTEMARLKKTSNSMREELTSTESELAETRTEIQGVNKELSAARNSLANLQALTEAERSGLTSIGEQIKQLREEGDQVKITDQSLAAKLDEIQEATLELEHLKAANLRANKENETAKITLASINEELQKATAEHHGIVARIAEARGDLEILESEIRQKSNEIARIKAERGHLQSLLDDEIQRFEEHTMEQTTVNLELEQSTRKLTRTKHEISEAESRLDSLSRETAEQERTAKNKLDELDQLNEQLTHKTQQAEQQEAMAREALLRIEEELARASASAAAMEAESGNPAPEADASVSQDAAPTEAKTDYE